MRAEVVIRLADVIEQLTEDMKASPEEQVAAFSMMIVENLNANESNFLKVNVGEQQLLISLQEASTVTH